MAINCRMLFMETPETKKTSEAETSEPQIISKDTLPGTDFVILQSKGCFRYGIDAVLLADYAVKNGGDFSLAIDFCTGNAAVPLMMCAKNKKAFFKGIEVQKESVQLAAQSVLLNGIKNIEIMEMDLNDTEKIIPENSADLVTVNPPYMKRGSGRSCKDKRKAIAREEILCTIDDVVRASAFVLKDSGKFCMIHRPERFSEIQQSLHRHGLCLKKLQKILPLAEEKATMILLLAEKNTGVESNYIEENPLVIYENQGTYSRQIKTIYSLQ